MLTTRKSKVLESLKAVSYTHLDVYKRQGATAFVPALVASGLDTTRFCYEGFLPVKKGRQTLLTALALSLIHIWRSWGG